MSNVRKLRRRKKDVCLECQAGDHTGNGHLMCPYCGHRLGGETGHALIGHFGYLCNKTGLFVSPE